MKHLKRSRVSIFGALIFAGQLTCASAFADHGDLGQLQFPPVVAHEGDFELVMTCHFPSNDQAVQRRDVLVRVVANRVQTDARVYTVEVIKDVLGERYYNEKLVAEIQNLQRVQKLIENREVLALSQGSEFTLTLEPAIEQTDSLFNAYLNVLSTRDNQIVLIETGLGLCSASSI